MFCFFDTISLKPKIKSFISGNNGIRTHNHLVCKRTLKDQAKLINFGKLRPNLVTVT